MATVRRERQGTAPIAGLALLLAAACAAAAPALQWGEAAPREELLRDWLWQDGGDPAACFGTADGHAAEQAVVRQALAGASGASDAAALQAECQALVAGAVPGKDPRWRDLYLRACAARRQLRLARLSAPLPPVVFTRHYNLGGSHYAYTEGQSDAQAERHFVPGAALCLLRLDGLFAQSATLVDAPAGVIRDPDVDYDGRHVLFSWKKSDREDDYHLYELDASTGEIRQITSGLGFADYEGIYLPDGDLLFNSTRCVQIVDCWWTEVSNLYACGRDGRRLRRLGYDQVHTNYPQVLTDGRIVYTRWDYNDRGQLFPQPLFVMNADGTGQTEYYGNNSWFPTTLIHARPLPGEDRLLAIATGHHSDQAGKLALVDRGLGQQENSGVRLVAPPRETPADHIDAYGQDGEQFGYPYPLDARRFLVSYAPAAARGEGLFSRGHFGLYLMDLDGNRELLAWEAKTCCSQPVPLAPRVRPPLRATAVDAQQTTGTYLLQDIYAGPGLRGVPRGTIKRLRVVGLDFRAAGVRSNGNSGPAGAALVSTPVAVNNGAWDVKTVYGETPVADDGSAWFTAPARVPLYFQALDEKGRMVQTMRTWSTLQPGEQFSCVGCHENKPATPLVRRPLAARQPPQSLQPFYGPPRGFSFVREIQPLLDRNCTACHADRGRPVPGRGAALTAEQLARGKPLHAADLPWQYTFDKPAAGWEQREFDSSAWARGTGPFGRQGTPALTIRTPWHTPDIWLRASLELPESLAGHQLVALTVHDEDAEIYLNGTLAAAATGYVVAPTPLAVRPAAVQALRQGTNTVAVHCHQTVGGQGISVQLLDLGTTAAPAAPQVREGKPQVFSLLGVQTPEGASGRQWSDSYLALTNSFRDPGGGPLAAHSGALVSFLGAQTAPPMLPPYYAGATQSKLLEMLERGHGGVKLSEEERRKLSCWIDLNIPYCGDYQEAHAWSAEEQAKYSHFLQKRRQSEALEDGGRPPEG